MAKRDLFCYIQRHFYRVLKWRNLKNSYARYLADREIIYSNLLIHVCQTHMLIIHDTDIHWNMQQR